MPFTFSAGSFSFLKSSTASQSNIEQNNNVDNVNKNNINVNGYSDTSNNGLLLDNNLNLIPLERSRSLDNPISLRNNRRNSNSSSNNLKNINRKAWYKSIFVRIHQTLSPSRWNVGNVADINNTNIIKIINNSNIPEYFKDDNTVDNNNNRGETGCDDDPIMMKSRSIVPDDIRMNAFVRHGNTHDFYVTTKCKKNDTLLKRKNSRNLTTFDGVSSSVFEKCAQTPRHFAKETEVLGKVGRFTIVREREDFDTTYFDQCHCQQKPCRFSTSGCSGSHPVLPPESLPQIPSRQRTSSTVHQQSNKHYSWSSKSRQSFYCNPTPSFNSSRYSLPSLQNNNGPCPVSDTISKASSTALSQSASSPNLVHLNQRLKNENINKNPAPKNNNVRSNSNIIVCSNVGKYSNPPTNGITTSAIKKSKKPSLVNIKSTDPVLPFPTNPPSPPASSPPSNPPTPTYPSKFYLHNPNEPHTTINSHSGRKFEVEWISHSSTTKSSSSTSSTSSTSSDPFSSSSPSSTISSVFSMASSPDKSVTNTLSRRCSTLSSKCGRKFEVTIITSNGGNSLMNISPQSTIVSSPVENNPSKL